MDACLNNANGPMKFSLMSMYVLIIPRLKTIYLSSVFWCPVVKWFCSLCRVEIRSWSMVYVSIIDLYSICRFHLKFKLHWFKTVFIDYSVIYKIICLNNKDVLEHANMLKLGQWWIQCCPYVHQLTSPRSLWLLSKVYLCLEHRS